MIIEQRGPSGPKMELWTVLGDEDTLDAAFSALVNTIPYSSPNVQCYRMNSARNTVVETRRNFRGCPVLRRRLPSEEEGKS